VIPSLVACAQSAPGREPPPQSPPQEAGPAPRDPQLPLWSEAVPEKKTKNPNANPTLQAAKAKAPVKTQITLLHPRSATPWLGVELQATDASAPGVLIERVLPGSPADNAKLHDGDILLAMGDSPMISPSDVSDWVRAQTPQTFHPLTLLREGKRTLLRAQLKGMPDFEDRLRLAFIGRLAPEIAGVATFQGEAASLAELKGQVIILEFWASYCGVCRYIAPILDNWHRTYRPQGAHVLGITVDGPEAGLRTARETKMSYTLASDPHAKITRTYLASAIPTVFIIDQKRIVRDVMVGYSAKRIADTQALIESLLAP